ncbi:bacitracin ABC transporter ATP-binding protein [Paenibacillus sp. J45TS6]|uniref:ABC transporter ATP-binding protein n=1 Tax=Paenibacillus sp. J45TS6 TaxID=2807196 RepID=UPI001B2037E7|nr:ABC transporter ATP-binding protein [Paenibacillus sp. J45TS6]GIP45961.1 bacitracin ABC transporter ATP-binding protein [Paenibacillus sp. J45TS6]
MKTIIEVNGLVKAFGNKRALSDINFTINKGEIFGFLGPSGSGKTTTVKILTSQLQATGGTVNVFGQEIRKTNDADHKRRIGILTDNSALYERLTIQDNLEMFCSLYDVEKKRIAEVLEEVNLASERKTLVKKLSKGMKQRVMLARAMLHKPDLLFLDEPTSALDPVNTLHIHEGLRKLNREGTTIFLTTHNMSEAESLCSRVAFIHEGVIKAMGTPEELRLQHSDDSLTVTVKEEGRMILQQNEESAGRIAGWMQAGKLLSIHSNEPTLGDIFVQMTGRELQ